jgi:hypothetical protein
VAELHEQLIKVHDALRTAMATHTREMKEQVNERYPLIYLLGKGAHLKAINGKLIAAETSLEKLRDKEIRSSQLARQKAALMSNFFAAKRCVQACTTEASTSTMEAATSAPAVGYTVEQVRAQQNDRIFRRAVQNLHVQIIKVTGEHARTHGR